MQMDAYKHILVAVDGSDTSNRAVEEAIRLAAEMQAELRIVHAVDEMALNWDAGYADFGEIREAYRKSGEAILDRSATAAREAGLKADAQAVGGRWRWPSHQRNDRAGGHGLAGGSDRGWHSWAAGFQPSAAG